MSPLHEGPAASGRFAFRPGQLQLLRPFHFGVIRMSVKREIPQACVDPETPVHATFYVGRAVVFVNSIMRNILPLCERPRISSAE